MRRLLAATALLVLPLALASSCASFGGAAAGARLERVEASAHYRDGTFQNSLPTRNAMEEHGFWGFVSEALNGEQVRVPEEEPPVIWRQADDFAVAPESGLRITWLGHSTTLIEIDGYRVLTDPIWSQRASPVSFAGPKRFTPAPLPLDALPELDAILISHDHYDHLDESTIRELARVGTPFFVPLGVGAHLEHWGVGAASINELEWWQEARIGPLTLVSTPARHFSGRSLLDRNHTLWTSWAILGPEHRVYFSGDTGMFPGFAEIGERYGPFDVTMLEVGAYNSMWADVHLGPEQAIEAHRMLRGELMLPIHWGTFNLAFHGWTEPAERIVAASADISLVVWQAGQSIDPADPPALVRWWPQVPWKTAQESPVVASGMDGPTHTVYVGGTTSGALLGP